MESSDDVVAGLRGFYEAFSSGEVEQFSAAIADFADASVIGTGPGEGHTDRADWVRTYDEQIAELGLVLRGGDSPSGWAAGDLGFALDEPAFVLPDGSTLPTRLTAVLTRDSEAWRIAHLHFSVGVPDDEAVEPAA